MSYEAKLRTAIARAIAAIEDEQSLAQACVRFGLEDGGPVDFWENKKQYVEDRLTDKPLTALIAISEVLLRTYESHKLHIFRLNEALRLAQAGGKRRISEITGGTFSMPSCCWVLWKDSWTLTTSFGEFGL